MSILCKASEEKQLEDSWEVPGLQRNLEQSAEPLRKRESGQSKGLSPSLGFQHHRKFPFSPDEKPLSVLWVQLRPRGSVLVVFCVLLSTAGCNPDFPQKAAPWGF